MATGDGLAAWLQLLALPWVSEPIRVKWTEPDHVPVGRVHWDGDAWEIDLRAGLPADVLPFVWYHELAHVVLGHVARSRAAAVPLERATVLFPGIAAQVAADHERAADQWASERVAQLGKSARRFLELLAD